MNDEIKEILDYFQKDVDKYEESKRYLMQKYGYDEETIDNISQHERHINTKKLLDYITNLQQENEYLKKNNPEQNIEHFRIIKENKRKINNLREENKTLQENNQAMQEEMARVWEENERLKEQSKKDNHILGCNFASKDKYKQRYEDYKSRCEKASEIIKKEKANMGYAKYDSCLLLIENILQNGSDNK